MDDKWFNYIFLNPAGDVAGRIHVNPSEYDQETHKFTGKALELIERTRQELGLNS